MPTPVRRCGHENLRANMATAEYRRGHGTHYLEQLLGPDVPRIHTLFGRPNQYNGLSFTTNSPRPLGTDPAMADTFDAYREALVVETATVWPADVVMDPTSRTHFEAALHAHPESASHLEYVRVHSGFCRTIHVTEDDLERLAAKA